MKDTYYFSHDYNPRGDEKIQGLLYEMGWEGYGLYWGLVELLYQNDGYLQLECKRIAFELRTDCNKIEKLINDFDLFMINENNFTSKSVLHRLKKRKEKTLQTQKAAKIRWDKGKQDDADAMRLQSESNAIKGKERKGKDTIIKEIITYFNQKANKNFTLKSKANNSMINARLNEGFRIEDFKKIIDNKVRKWKGKSWTGKNDEICYGDDYLRPETLFCAKHFESYLNEPVKKTDDEIASDYIKKKENENKGN